MEREAREEVTWGQIGGRADERMRASGSGRVCRVAGAPWTKGSEPHEGNSLQDPDIGPGEEGAPRGV